MISLKNSGSLKLQVFSETMSILEKNTSREKINTYLTKILQLLR